jgi:hypothetical protein
MQHVERGCIGPLDVVQKEDERRAFCKRLTQAHNRFEQANACGALIPARCSQVGVTVSQFRQQAT